MPRGLLQEAVCHHPGASRKEELQEELAACGKSPRSRRHCCCASLSEGCP
eukprot:s10310_g1.t1